MTSFLRALAPWVPLFGLCACAAGAAPDTPGDDGIARGGGDAGSSVSSTFLGPNPLRLEPSAMYPLGRELTVAVQPAGVHVVRFALVAAGGSPADAALSATEVTTDEDGFASVLLTPPSAPTTFEVRASVGTGNSPARLSVVIEARGTATLRVIPSYTGGRDVSLWVADVYDDGRSCSDLEGNPPEGHPPPNPFFTQAGSESVDVPSVPVNRPLAVTLRAGFYAGGCGVLESAVEGEVNSIRVTVTNRPVQLDRSHLSLSLGLAESEAALTAVFSPVVETALAAVVGSSSDDVEALLDAMQELTSASARLSFASERASSDWDAQLLLALGANSAETLRNALAPWLDDAVLRLLGDDTFVGNLAPGPNPIDAADLSLSSVAGVDPSAAGFPNTTACSWTADAADNVVLGATLEFDPSALLFLLAFEPARGEIPDAESVADALARTSLHCETVATTLTTNSQTPGLSHAGCDLVCTRTLCERAVEVLVARASAASAGNPAELRIAATGSAFVGEEAEISALAGSWVGELLAGGMTADIGGGLSAEAD